MILILLIAFLTNSINDNFLTPGTTPAASPQSNSYLTLNDEVRHIAGHKAFEGFGDLLLPWENNASYYHTKLNNIGTLMPYHGNVKPDVVLASVNHMIREVNEGRKIFYTFYSDLQLQQDPSLRQTGLFFFPGKPGAPFAIVCPGGGFSYVGALHEGFPLAHEISRNNLNAFVIRYRTGSEQNATNDLAAAINFISANAIKLGVGVKDYSLWGGSAGARMVGNIAFGAQTPFRNKNFLKPAAVIIAYTGQSSYSSSFPPTFMTVASNDGIANAETMEKRAKNLRAAGVEVEFRRYKNAGHGFGTGIGTDAEGWMKYAITFWQKHITASL